MEEVILADTGALIAYLDESEEHHAWAVERWAAFTSTPIVCEAVLTEAAFLLWRQCRPMHIPLDMICCGALRLDFDLAAEASAVRDLMAHYTSVPMSLADACLVRLSEKYERCRVFTLDSDFRIYRRHRRRSIPLLIPP